VRTKDNIARVRRDEAAAAEVENEKLRRSKLAEQEARTALLRTRAGADSSGKEKKEEGKTAPKDFTSSTSADIYTAEGNVNFFKEMESGQLGSGEVTNKEREAEMKQEKEEQEKKIGLLTYLGQDTLEATKGKEWYHDATSSVSQLWSQRRLAGDAREQEGRGEEEEVSLKSKHALDPIDAIRNALKTNKPKSVTQFSVTLKNEACFDLCDRGNGKDKSIDAVDKQRSKRKLDSLQDESNNRHKKRRKRTRDSSEEYSNRRHEKRRKRSPDYSEEDRHDRSRKKDRSRDSSEDSRKSTQKKKVRKSKKRKISKSKKKSKKHRKQSSDSESDDSQPDKLAQMRRDRVEREAAERVRAQRLLSGLGPDTTAGPARRPLQQKYSSQFNALAARQNRVAR